MHSDGSPRWLQSWPREIRKRWQNIMRTQMSKKIEELTGRKVVGFMSDSHIDPDLAVEVFVLEQVADARA